MGNLDTAYPKHKQLHQHHYNEAVQRYFSRLEREGHDLSAFHYMLRNPGKVSPLAMAELARYLRTDIGTLLSNGIGRLNDFESLDAATAAHHPDQRLGVVETAT